jgi:cell division protein FtsQ|tara:strand:+ start:1923 stop:2684 length:762 start_codon:yes stop_codon:yes gene_type:complete
MKKNKAIRLLLNNLEIIVGSILIATIILLSFQWGSYRNVFEMDGLLITGENILEKSDYIELVGEIENQSIKDIDLEGLSEKLEQNPFVKAARVSKRYPNLIKVDIVEREPIAILNNKVQLMIDNEAVILPNNPFTENALIPVLSGFNPANDLYPEGQVTFSIKVKEAIGILNFIQKNYDDFYEEISELTINKNDEYVIILSEQPTKVILGRDNISRKIKILKNFDKALGQRQLTSYRLLDVRYSKQLVATEWT